ncbi:BON domain-containing protein [Pseudomonas matsuisoli]|uniref:Osmotically-inducible protein Y n=1 Tax=Pseudomonas matsuisoli TaxID=1515666 RepID=A0A917UZ95_9PSED|nr:BON domain-containing protein [Pseudomonas matsuisoli]GGJ99862.1 BON domain-containing protein [Pseudomonas matsuisoli]
MKTPFEKWTFAAVAAAALSLSLANAAHADSTRANGAQPMVLAANTVDNAEEAVSDTWITGKVKSAFLADDSISGMDIKVETNKGVVSLSGAVPSDAERDLAVEKAKSIKGVREVSADGLKSTE